MDAKLQFMLPISEKMEHFCHKADSDKSDLQQQFQLFSLFFEKITDNEAIGFTTLFSRIAYFGVRQKLPPTLIYDCQNYRKTLESGKYTDESIADLIAMGAYLVQAVSRKVFDYKWQIECPRPDTVFRKETSEKVDYSRILRGVLFAVDGAYVEVVLDNNPEVKDRIELDVQFEDQLRQIDKHMTLPVSVNLVDVTFRADQVPKAMGIVIRPDFLLSVTSVSECFSTNGATSLTYFGRKLIPSDTSIHMLLGNIVNHYLDELIHDPTLRFDDLLQDTFQIGPVQFLLMTDSEVKDCLSKAKVHFENLKAVVTTELAEAGITKERSYLEPSFYSNEFGLLGRLDLYHHNERTAKSDIVELKSGKLYQAHKYGLNQNHYIQTLLYDLILESVYNGKVRSTNYILYSANDSKRLRFAPRVRSKQLEALKLRNNILLLEEIMTNLDREDAADILKRLNPESIPKTYTFLRRDAKRFWEAYGRLSPLEQKYYRTFLSFISREFQLSKIGRHGVYSSNGLAGLWLDPMVEKADMFTILSRMEVLENNSDLKVPSITMGFTPDSNRLSKFRVGDIVVLYPQHNESSAVLSTQLFKCTILDIDVNKVELRLRARQKNYEIFRKYKYWNVEADSIDSGYRKQYHGLFDFMIANQGYKNRILGLQPPRQPDEAIEYSNDRMTEEQVMLTQKVLSAKDYFLLWGPPGTGKTSIMIAELVKYYYQHTPQELLILAYTNRAVDEICLAIHEILKGEYLRIGSRYSTAEQYRANLLSTRTEKVSNRSELLQVFRSSRVTVSTISSYQSKQEIKALKKFDLVIIDEASQLLEPMLVGMLSQFKKFVLIGDHKQLPAVVTQDKNRSAILDQELQEKVGLLDARTSLFERMYKQAIKHNWHWAYGGLTNQGRMHQDIVKFVSKEFYENKLSILSGISRLSDKSPLKAETAIQEELIANRLIFVNTPKGQNITRKTNLFEARIVTQLINQWVDIYKYNEKDITPASFGVITPFRSQIAMIKSQEDLSSDLPITIDTIERYQGGARDRIFISLAVSEAELLDSISNLSSEGVDRKLNVALTRAKEHLIIVGNKDILSRKGLYSRLIASAYELEIPQES